MKKNIYIIIGAGIIIIICGWLAFSNHLWQTNPSGKNNGVLETEKLITLVIDDGIKEPVTFKTDFVEGMNAFDLLKEGAEKSALSLKTKNYDMGVFIEAISGTENGQDGKYWLYYVNGKMPMIAADKQELRAADTVEFKFEKSQF